MQVVLSQRSHASNGLHNYDTLACCAIHKRKFVIVIRITSTSRISLLLHETESEARARMLITMISYECL